MSVSMGCGSVGPWAHRIKRLSSGAAILRCCKSFECHQMTSAGPLQRNFKSGGEISGSDILTVVVMSALH
jgi:hypothetical protein